MSDQLDDGRFRVPDGLDEQAFDVELDEIDVQAFRFPGPISEAYFRDRSFISFIQGPYGSAKTTTSFMKLIDRAQRMPICRDGVRRYRALVLRDTYRRMERTAIRSWHKWFPPSMGKWEGGQDRPSKHRLELEDLSGVPLDFEIEFAAVGDLDIEDFMGGYEITDLFLNEANLQKQDVLTYGAGRTGRFPSMKDLPAGTQFDYGVIGDLNAPEFDSWLLEMQFGDLDPALADLGKSSFFVQPGGRDAGAENIQNLPAGYYARLAAANALQPWWVARMIDNKPGYSRAGKPVYQEYSDTLHCAHDPLSLLPGLDLLLGFDAGMHPAGVVAQWTPEGQFRIVKEFCPGHMGPTRFGKEVLAWLEQYAPKHRIGRAWVDPTALDGADKANGELSWCETVESILGVKIMPAPSNEPTLRQDAVRQGLTQLIDGSKPGLLLSPACKDLRRGFNSHYRYNKVRSETGEGYVERPAKNPWSHPHDALQYVMLGAMGRISVTRGERMVGGDRGSRQRSADDDDPRFNRGGSSRPASQTGFDVFRVGH